MPEKYTKEELLQLELKARQDLRRFKERRAKSLVTVTNNVHEKYNKLVESYVAQLPEEVVNELRKDEAVEDLAPEEVTDITEGGD